MLCNLSIMMGWDEGFSNSNIDHPNDVDSLTILKGSGTNYGFGTL